MGAGAGSNPGTPTQKTKELQKCDSFFCLHKIMVEMGSVRKIGGVLVKLMELFNHSSVSITKRYLGLRQEEILETYDCLSF